MNLCNKILYAPYVQLYLFLFKQISRRTTKIIVIYYVLKKTIQMIRSKRVKNIFFVSQTHSLFLHSSSKQLEREQANYDSTKSSDVVEIICFETEIEIIFSIPRPANFVAYDSRPQAKPIETKTETEIELAKV